MSNNNDYRQIIKQARQYLEYLNDIGVKDIPFDKSKVKSQKSETRDQWSVNPPFIPPLSKGGGGDLGLESIRS